MSRVVTITVQDTSTSRHIMASHSITNEADRLLKYTEYKDELYNAYRVANSIVGSEVFSQQAKDKEVSPEPE